MKRIGCVALGPVEEDVLASVGGALTEVFGVEISRLDPLPDPSFAYDERRGQYSSTLVLRELISHCAGDLARLLAVTERDLFIPMLSFIFGQAQVPGKVAVVSLARLHQEFYGLEPARHLLLARVSKEAVHEMGHTFGLVHCARSGCAMSLSTNIRQVDAKGLALCADCGLMLREAIMKTNREAAA